MTSTARKCLGRSAARRIARPACLREGIFSATKVVFAIDTQTGGGVDEPEWKFITEGKVPQGSAIAPMELRDYIRETLTQVEAQVPKLTTSPPDLARQFAAAGLMRCCALLRGVCVLEDAGLGALAGILERQHWETWLLSMHVVLRGDEALKEIAGDDLKYKRLLSEKLALNIDYHPDLDVKPDKLNVYELAEQLGPLLEKAGETGNTNVVSGYDVTYRVQSTFAVHANLATIGAYLKYGETSWGVEPNPRAPFGALGMTPALHTLHLAWYVFEKFGLPIGEIESLWDRLLAFVKAAQAANPAS